MQCVGDTNFGCRAYFGEKSGVYVPDGGRLYTAPSGIRAK